MHRILFLDAYDSFTNNIVSLLRDITLAEIDVIKIDDVRYLHLSDQELVPFLRTYEAAVAGPGPGHPSNPNDVGLIARLWTLEAYIPVLGICLGFQSLCLAFGASVQRLVQPRHGIVAKVEHQQDSVFAGLGDTLATQYHSLCVNINVERLPSADASKDTQLWSPTNQCPELIPISWDLTDITNGPVLMGVKHACKPFYGVQFHLESACSTNGTAIVRNWWYGILDSTYCPSRLSAPLESFPVVQPTSGSVYANAELVQSVETMRFRLQSQAVLNRLNIRDCNRNSAVRWKVFDGPHISVRSFCQHLDIGDKNRILLETGTKNGATTGSSETGRYSIIGLVDDSTYRFSYLQSAHTLHLYTSDRLGVEEMQVDDPWFLFQSLMRGSHVAYGPETPFWGGLMGFITYEAGLVTIDVQGIGEGGPEKPSICFAFVERSIVLDHLEGTLYLQSIRNDDEEWLEKMSIAIAKAVAHIGGTESTTIDTDQGVAHTHVSHIGERAYCAKVSQCHEEIRAGNSYELCLTDTTRIITSPTDPWSIYQRLQRLNPAPFSAYVHLDLGATGVSIVSSSPERFLSWSREGAVQYRPIKGTVKKSPGVTRADAERALLGESTKDRAENLMIVDLIRHDLHSVACNVRVSKLFSVEEYETVFQLVSVVEGKLENEPPPTPLSSEIDRTSEEPQVSSSHPLSATSPSLSASSTSSPSSRSTPPSTTCPTRALTPEQKLPSSRAATGVDVLRASLPPGSMTGAPKKRSCEILSRIEGKPRGVYSGVLGYLDVGGGGDFSVVIRTAWRWWDDVEVANETVESNESEKKRAEAWRVGAGGAVTIQSTAEGEYEEMMAKRDCVIAAFR